MKLHANAKTTPKTRLLLVQRIQDGWDTASAAEAVGVSRRCAWKWLARYRSEGLAFGAEINVHTSGADVGEGGILLGGVTLWWGF